jgi:hypothetical protein
MSNSVSASIRRAAVTIVAAALTLLAVGCDQWPLATGVTVDERIQALEDALNQDDRSDLYLLFHPDTQSRDQIKDQEVFDTGPLSAQYQTFTITVEEIRTLTASQKDVTAKLKNANTALGESYDLGLLMETYGENWYIKTLTLVVDENTDPYEIKHVLADAQPAG